LIYIVGRIAMNRALGLLILLIIFAASCGGGPIVPTDHPGGEHEPEEFCINFERNSADGAVDGANAALLYRELGITFPSNPVIINNGALCGGAGVVPGPINNQCLFQGDPGAARPERSCGPLEILIDPGLEVGKVEFEARNVGFISTPVEIVATAYGEEDGVEVQVDQYRKVSLSRLGDLQPFEIVKIESLGSEPPITRVVVEYRTCPPHVVINNLCIKPKQRAISTIGQSDAGANRLVYYFDNRERKSYIQLANLSDSEVEVHVQVWMVNSTIAECEEIDFYDNYTAKDVHTYDMLDIIRNNGPTLSFPPGLLSGIYGFVVISKSEGPSDSLVGSMRIVDNAGYEYKTNAVAPESVRTSRNKFGSVNFNNSNGNRFSELIGFTYTILSPDTVYASGGIATLFGTVTDNILIVDKSENEISCSPRQFSCSDGEANIGLDYSLPNNNDPDRVTCPTNIINASNNAGWYYLPFADTVCTDPAIIDSEGNCLYDIHFVGFIGLNNGSSSGTFDSWWGGKISDDE